MKGIWNLSHLLVHIYGNTVVNNSCIILFLAHDPSSELKGSHFIVVVVVIVTIISMHANLLTLVCKLRKFLIKP